MLGVQTHIGPQEFLAPFRKDPTWMNGMPVLNQDRLPGQGIDAVPQ